MPDSAIVLNCIDREKFCTSCTTQDCCCEENNGSCVDYEWEWDEDHATYGVVLSKQNSEVIFHNAFSCGTAAVRGNKLLEKGRHHYWEIKMLTPIYGTDVMVGVGTSKVNLNSTTTIFCSLLGLDQESFGFSYVGYIQHCGKKRNYGSYFGEGSLVGVHLDMWRGTLEFWLDRKPLGIAFTGLRDIMLYPMVCSTAAQSKMRLTYSCSVPASLQTECLAVLKPSHKEYLTAVYPGLRYLSESIFASILQRHLHDTDDEVDDLKFLTDYMIFDDFDFALVGAGRTKKKKSTHDSPCNKT
ncbi:SPRY domain-containing SOCS box protein 3 isoform X2 [Andrena cerasifolii]|uniref:SPRY domain-containing SOCS box protein 3 isoform X2 n=1 Tax=Andrena cerasifolii TaxID=2819439 RepID=UPI00403814B9